MYQSFRLFGCICLCSCSYVLLCLLFQAWDVSDCRTVWLSVYIWLCLFGYLLCCACWSLCPLLSCLSGCRSVCVCLFVFLAGCWFLLWRSSVVLCFLLIDRLDDLANTQVQGQIQVGSGHQVRWLIYLVIWCDLSYTNVIVTNSCNLI